MEAKNLTIREVLATNCKKTIEVEIEADRCTVHASVPMGTSTGKYETISLPVKKVIKNFLDIKKEFVLEDFFSQEEVDSKLRDIDKTPNFSRIGGNLALGISSAYLKAFAAQNSQEVFQYFSGKTMPKPLANVAGGWGEESEIQEFLLLPNKQKSFKDSVFRIAEAYIDLGVILKKVDKTFKTSKNYESGWVTNTSTTKLMDILSDLCDDYKLRIGMDVAATDRWDGRTYVGRIKEKHRDFMTKLIEDFDVLYMEDPFHEDDFDSFSWLTENYKNTLICGDDLYATNPERLRMGIEKNATNSILIKPNQIGTITDVIKVVDMAKKHKMTTVISHRSGTTDETLLCHLAVGLECDLAKFGISGERIIKINELLRIEEKLQH